MQAELEQAGLGRLRGGSATGVEHLEEEDIVDRIVFVCAPLFINAFGPLTNIFAGIQKHTEGSERIITEPVKASGVQAIVRRSRGTGECFCGVYERAGTLPNHILRASPKLVRFAAFQGFWLR